jgi:hypothetical protein
MLPICLHIASETCHAGRSEAPTHPEKNNTKTKSKLNKTSKQIEQKIQ